jgi:hypothetical protein
MAESNAVSRAIKLIIARYKSLPAIVLRAIVANLLSTGDLASDLYTIESLFALGHDGPAYALLTMVCLSFAVQVRANALPRCTCHLPRTTSAVALCCPTGGLRSAGFWPCS